ncbi:MAG: LacI family DNA-binding transcriptional regulator [Kiritimatiellia bacterium]
MNRERKTKGATIQQIADFCEVSSMTVSRALRSDQSVSVETRTAILKAAETLGYQPRVRMGRPRQIKSAKKSSTVEVIFGIQLHTAFYTELLTSIEAELAEHKHDCVIRTSAGGFEEFVALCDVLRISPETPTLVVGYLPHQQLRTLLEARPHALLVDHTGDPKLALPYSSLSFDNVEASRMMVQHLLEKGCQRILLIKGFADHYFSRDVEQGYREALMHAGQEVDPPLIVETDFTTENTVGKLQEVLDEGLVFDGIFTNDEMALAVLHTLHKRGIRVPEDIAVAGCDGLPFSLYTIPSLSTMVLDYKNLGRMAVETILRQGRNSSYVASRTRLLANLVVRESTLK